MSYTQDEVDEALAGVTDRMTLDGYVEVIVTGQWGVFMVREGRTVAVLADEATATTALYRLSHANAESYATERERALAVGREQGLAFTGG